jgi:bis(5'-nucleosyl)-tetraphosphatase (symmetrical)
MRSIVITDIHGCLDEAQELVEKTGYKKGTDRLICLGDLVDRGPNSKGVVDFIRKTADVVLMGNHEEKHVRYAKREKEFRETGKKNQMSARGDFLAVHHSLTEQDFEWLGSLPLVVQINKYWVGVHAGFEPFKSMEQQNPKALLRVRFVDEKTGVFKGLDPNFQQPAGTKYWSEMWDGPESILYGHCVRALDFPTLDGNNNGACCLALDTGCVFGGNLTAAVIEDDVPLDGQCRLTTVQVKSRQVYAKGWALGSEEG